MAHKDIFLVSDNALRASSYIDRNVSGDILTPAIKYVQDDMVEHILGTSLFNRLKEMVDSGDIALDENSCYSNLVNGYIFDVIMWGVMAEIQVPLTYKIRNKGTVQTGDDQVSPTYLSELKYIETYYQNKADYYRARLTTYLRSTAARACMPELKDCPACYELRPASGDTVKSNFYFGKIK